VILAGIVEFIRKWLPSGLAALAPRMACLMAATLLVGCSGSGSGGGAGVGSGPPPPAHISIVTHHYDNGRTGWNQNESILTPSAVAGAHFALLRSVALDDQVDAQPLVVAGLATVGGQATNGHDVVYVTTENDTVYAIDSITGAVLASRNLGAPVPKPDGCFTNGPNVGINSTGVIDQSTNALYVVAYTMENGAPTYRIHGLDLATLQDRVAPPVITASHPLDDGSTFVFNASYERQRAALLLFNNTVYAAFASFCDFSTGQSRGWVLGWNEGSLTPLAANRLTNIKTGNGYYLSAIWMSGAGLAADGANLYAVTGNSNPDGSSYDAAGGANFPESLIKMSADLTSVTDWFTPANYKYLEGQDQDFGAGGVMLLPGSFQQGGSPISLATAAGKDGMMYLLNTAALGHGGPAAASPAPVDAVAIGYCWCAESFYVGVHGPTIVSSGGGLVPCCAVPGPTPSFQTPEPIVLWAAPTTIPASGAVLSNVAQSEDLCCGDQDPGFFTSVSSQGSSNVVIWAVTRPSGTSPDTTGGYPMTLWAFSESLSNGKLTKLLQVVGGEWGPDSMNGNANAVPAVANGQVYVASYKLLKIFGLQ
jgi:hypothetical protein